MLKYLWLTISSISLNYLPFLLIVNVTIISHWRLADILMTQDFRQMISDSPFKMIIRTLLASLTVVGFFSLYRFKIWNIMCFWNKNKQTGITNATNQIKYTKLLFVLAVKMVIHKISQRSLTHFSIFNIVISMLLTTCTSYSFSINTIWRSKVNFSSIYMTIPVTYYQ